MTSTRFKLMFVFLLSLIIFSVFDNLDTRAQAKSKKQTQPSSEKLIDEVLQWVQNNSNNKPLLFQLVANRFAGNKIINPIGIFLGEIQNPFSIVRGTGIVSELSSEFTVTNNSDSGVGSLRWAIEQANSSPGQDTIYFHTGYMTGSTIMPQTQLPPLTDDGTLIDASWNWIGDWPGGKPGVTIDGSLAYGIGLKIEGADDVTIKGLEVQNFSTCIYIDNDSANNTIGEGTSPFGGGRMLVHGCDSAAVFINGNDNRVIGSYIGTSIDGNQPEPNLGVGVKIQHGKRNQIGGEGPLETNIIGSSYHGVQILGTEAISNTVINNLIGIGSNSSDIGNTINGVYIVGGASENWIGGWNGSDPIFNIFISIPCKNGNVISNSGESGIKISGEGTEYNIIHANLIDDNELHGIEIDSNSDSTIIKCNNTIIRNNYGITVRSSIGNYIWYNYIGVDTSSTPYLGNDQTGIYLSDNSVSSHLLGNVIGNNITGGILIENTNNCLVHENFIGVDRSGTDIGNAGPYGGLYIHESWAINIAKNSIAYNHDDGIHIIGVDADHNFISRNSIYRNTSKGIGLESGAQNGITPPSILSSGCPIISGDGAPANGRVEIFSDVEDEGRYYEGYTVADNYGVWTFSGPFRGPNLTVTAIDEDGNTSEFSFPFYGAGICSVIYLPSILH